MLRLHPRLRKQLLLLLLGVFFLGAGVLAVSAASRGSNDFDGFHRAARHLALEGSFSDARDIVRYPPTFPLLLIPLGLLPVEIAAGLWYLLNVAALLTLPRLLGTWTATWFGGKALDTWKAQAPAWWLIAPFIAENLTLGQSGPLLLFASAWALCRFSTGQAGGKTAGFVLALAAGLKAVPGLFFALPLAWRRTRTALCGAAVALILCVFMALSIAGAAECERALKDWGTTIESQTPWNLVSTNRSLRYNNQGLGVSFARTLGDTGPLRSPGRVQLAALPLEFVWKLYYAILVLATCAWMDLLRIERKSLDASSWSRGLAAKALLILLISPIVWTHYFIWWLPAGFVLLRRPKRLWILGSLSIVAVAIPSLRSLGFHTGCTITLLAWVWLEARAHHALAALESNSLETDEGASVIHPC